MTGAEERTYPGTASTKAPRVKISERPKQVANAALLTSHCREKDCLIEVRNVKCRNSEVL